MRVGVVGCGYITEENHLPALLKTKGVEVITVCDKDENKARKTAKRFGLSGYCTDFSDVLNKKPDIIDVCTPPKTHALLSIQALDAGCHVLVEKPLALSVNEADSVIEACQRNNRKLCVGHNSLFNQVVIKAKALIESGAVGDLLHVDVRYSIRPDDRMMVKGFWTHSLPGGIFGEIAPHPVYLQQLMLGDIRHIQAIAKKSSNIDWVLADELRVLLQSDSATGSISVSCNSPRYSATMDIYGTLMNLHLDLWTLVMTVSKPAKFGPLSSALGNLSSSFQLASGTILTALRYPIGKVHSGHFILIPKFIASIRNDRPTPVSGENGRETVRILEEIWKQISRGV